jgi:hypothetical protein
MRRERLATSEIGIPARTDLAAQVARAREAAPRGMIHSAGRRRASSASRSHRVLRTAMNCAGPPVPVHVARDGAALALSRANAIAARRATGVPQARERGSASAAGGTLGSTRKEQRNRSRSSREQERSGLRESPSSRTDVRRAPSLAAPSMCARGTSRTFPSRGLKLPLRGVSSRQ